MHYLKDVFEGVKSQHAHNKFIRYSKGEFVGALLKIKLTKNNVKVYGSFHLVDELLRIIADYLGNKIVHIKGSVVWNEDLSEKLASVGIKYSKVTKSRGIYKYILDNDVEIKDFVDKFNDYNLLLSFKLDNISYVTKSSFPKPNKEFSNDFCKVTLPIELKDKILDEFAFDLSDKEREKLKEVEISHKILIDDIDVPEAKNFEEARRKAIRKGTIERHIKINGSEEKSNKIKLEV
jgi:hypothetical protein